MKFEILHLTHNCDSQCNTFRNIILKKNFLSLTLQMSKYETDLNEILMKYSNFK